VVVDLAIKIELIIKMVVAAAAVDLLDLRDQ
jgi:hypothetical protein